MTKKRPSNDILQRIHEAQASNAESLDLTHFDVGRTVDSLREIPPEVFDLTQLRELNLSSHNLTNIPSAIGKLQNLRILDVSENQLSVIPQSIMNLPNLTSLIVYGNQLQTLPTWLIDLPGLTELDVGHNKLVTIPEKVGRKRNWKVLRFPGCNLKEVPEWIGELLQLVCLDLGHNFLSDLPQFMRELKNLEELRLFNNQFTRIPDVIFDIVSLRKLDLFNFHGRAMQRQEGGILEYERNNHITEIPPDIVRLVNLVELRVSEDIVNPPAEIVFGNDPTKRGSANLDSVRNYYLQLSREGVDYLYEAKLLLIGEGGAGKTSLAEKILDMNYQLRDSEKSTEGIDVLQWSFPLDNGQPFRINVWDFGGQEIYHATHQYFLTKRSLYVLVTDTRKEDTDFYYWLNIVELLSDNSPVIIIKNEKQDRHREIGERQLRGQFTNLQEIRETNLATNRGLPEILKTIKHYIQQLPHVGAPLPKTWVEVRKWLEADIHNYISLDEYLDICEQNGFLGLKDKLQLSGYLHDLGVCLHFQDDPLLRKIVILKPKWGTDAAYKVLDNKTVIRNLGRFSRSDLVTIWDAPEYANMQNELLQLMINFKLCYQIPGSRDRYIAPQLLTENQPDYYWDTSSNLFLRYTYEFMPKGILTQFIVAMHALIVDQRLVWKSGVVIEKDHTKAEVIEHYGKREVTIRIAGKHKKELLAIALYELDKIHQSYRRLKYNKLIPCNCPRCKESQEPHFYAFETLRQFTEDGQVQIQCQKHYHMVNVWGLIDDIIPRTQLAQELRTRDGVVIQGPVDQVVIQQTQSGDQAIQQTRKGDNIMAKKSTVPVKPRSAWANGSFYLFAFVVVIAGLGALSNFVSWYVLPILLIAGAIFVPLIGAFQLRQDDRLSEVSFVDLMKLVIAQLPLIRKSAVEVPKDERRG